MSVRVTAATARPGIHRVAAGQLARARWWHDPPIPSALITGMTGQDGLYLAALPHATAYAVNGLVRGQHNPKLELVHALLPDVFLHPGDLTDLSRMISALRAS